MKFRVVMLGLVAVLAAVALAVPARAEDTASAFPPTSADAGAGLAYSSYLGGIGSDTVNGVAMDELGNIYLAGGTNSAEFPATAGAYDTTYNGGSVGAFLGPSAGDAFLAKLDPNGALVLATFLGGSADETATGIGIDASGNLYVAGLTDSPDFPTTANAFDRSQNGDVDAYVAKLDPTGSKLLYATFLGGSGFDVARDIDVGVTGLASIAGWTHSTDFPTTPSAFDRSLDGPEDALVAVLDTARSGSQSLLYSTYLGGSGGGNQLECAHGIASDSSGNVYVTGCTTSPDFPTTPGAFDRSFNGGADRDAYVAKLDPTAQRARSLVYSTFLGGGARDFGLDLDVDASGNAYVTGITCSRDFPTTLGAFDPDGSTTFAIDCFAGMEGFVSKFDASGSNLLYSTLLGGRNFDNPFSIAVDSSGSAHVNGFTNSGDFPTTPGAFDRSFNGGSFLGSGDAFVVKLNPSGSDLLYSTYLGGADSDSAQRIALNAQGDVYVCGQTASRDFPTTDNALDPNYNGGFDGFIAKLVP